MLASIALSLVTDPNVAFLLLVVGMVGVIAELYHPGSFVPGIVGTISLLLALVALHITSHGILGTGAVIAFLLGGFLLFTPLTPLPAGTPLGPAWPASDGVEVNRWLLLGMSGTIAAFFLVALRAGLRARQLPVLDPLMRI